jgi:hypothetical protein
MAIANSSRGRRPRVRSRGTDTRSVAPNGSRATQSPRQPATRRPEAPAANAQSLDDVLGQFADALSIVETSHRALDSLQEDSQVGSAEILTLSMGIARLRRVYNGLDVAIMQLGRGAKPAH